MKERPILFNSEMVRQILAGNKTQTRRVVKLLDGNTAPTNGDEIYAVVNGQVCTIRKTDKAQCAGQEGTGRYFYDVWEQVDVGLVSDPPDYWFNTCPQGVVGDRLWVRESWCPVTDPFVGACEAVGYAADKDIRAVAEGSFKNDMTVFNWEKPDAWKFKPSIHMPRWASRITLEIVNVRVERLQDITEADAMAEGVEGGCTHCGSLTLEHPVLPESTTIESYRKLLPCIEPQPDHRDSFLGLWNAINGKRHPWDENPFVWVIEFRVCDS